MMKLLLPLKIALLLIPVTQALDIALPVWVKHLLAPLLPCRLDLRLRDIPIGPALHADGTQIVTELFGRRTTEEPVAVIDLVNDETWFEHNHMRNHGIVSRIRVFGDIEVLLDDAAWIGQERPVRAYPGSIFVALKNIVRRDGDEPAIADLHLSMKPNQPFSLAAVLRTVTAAA